MKFSKLLPALPCAPVDLAANFRKQHQYYEANFPAWSLISTRRKLSAAYWLSTVVKHYSILLSLASLGVMTFGHPPVFCLLMVLLPAGLLVFTILFFCLYWPVYQTEFLPHLDACVENYKGLHLEGLQLCKKQQYTVVSLMLIHCVYRELAGIEMPLINTANAGLLARQYGVSAKSIGPALALILRADWNRKSVRKRTEIVNDFETAKSYFRELSADRAIQLLENLEQRILQ